jgi:hypothetical protein
MAAYPRGSIGSILDHLISTRTTQMSAAEWRKHIKSLETKALKGDETARKALCLLVLK